MNLSPMDKEAKPKKSVKAVAHRCGEDAVAEPDCNYFNSAITMDGYDDCIVGVVERFGQDPIVCYDKEKVICQLESEGATRDDAEEFFYFNQIGAWVGESTPCFLSVYEAQSNHHSYKGGVPHKRLQINSNNEYGGTQWNQQ